MLGIALLGAPFFLWVIGRSLADLPWPQRILSVLLRIAFVALLALGLSRLARTATTQKVCHGLPRRRLRVGARRRHRGRARRDPEGASIRSPRTRSSASSRSRSARACVPMADDATKVPELERHDARAPTSTGTDKDAATAKKLGLDAATDIALRAPARLRPLPGRATCAAPCSSPTACRPTAISSPRRTAPASSA